MNYPLETILLPMGAKEVKDEVKMDALWDNPEYICETKYDGSRYVSVGGRMFSRRVSDVTHFPVEKTDNIPHIVDILSKFPNLILDGEVYYEGMTSNEVTSIMGASSDKARWRQGFGFTALPENEGKGMWRMERSDDWIDIPKKEAGELKIKIEQGTLKPLKYVAFDILRDLDGNWLVDLPWISRRAKLLSIYAEICMALGVTELPDIELSRVEEHNKRDFYKEIMDKGGEGVILKSIKGKYIPDAKPMWNWVKVKKHITVDVVIMGFKPAVKDYAGDELDTWLYWENSETGDLHMGSKEDLPMGSGWNPVTKFYWMNWIGAVTFGQLDPTNVATICERDGENCKEYPQLKELGYFSGINEELRADMSKNPSKYIGECVEIGAMEQTKDGFYRHPQFSRMRPDKNPSECVIGA